MTAISVKMMIATRAQLVHWRYECATAQAAGDDVRIQQCRRHIAHCAAVMSGLEKSLHRAGSG
jgi:ribosomal protein L29